MKNFSPSSLLFLYFSIAATSLTSVLQDGFHQSAGLLRTIFTPGGSVQSKITVLPSDEKESFLKVEAMVGTDFD